MAQAKNLMGVGVPAAVAQEICGNVANTLTATGSSSLANSYAVGVTVSIFTTAPGNSGARLPTANPGDTFFIANYDANTMLIYPATSSAKLNNGSAGASVSLATLKSAICVCIDGTSYLVIVSA